MSSFTRITVLIVNPHGAMRHQLRQQLSMADEIKVVGEADCGEAALELCDYLQPDVVLMDIIMPGLDGMTITQILRSRFPNTQVLLISGNTDGKLIPIALRAGAIGYLRQDVAAEELIQAVRAVATGLPTLSAEALEWLIQAPVSAGTRPHAPAVESAPDAADHALDLYFSLTHRERQVLNLVLLGYTSAEIGTLLYISPRTAEKHRANMMSKLDVRNQYELARLAYHIGVMPATDEEVTRRVQQATSAEWARDLSSEHHSHALPHDPVAERMRA